MATIEKELQLDTQTQEETPEQTHEEENLDIEDQTQDKTMEKLQKIQQLQDLVTAYKLAKDFISLSDLEIRKLMASTKKGTPNFKKASRKSSTPGQHKILTKLPSGKPNKPGKRPVSSSVVMVDYTKKYLNVLETITRNLYPDDSNKLFKKRFDAICNGKFKEDAYRNKIMQFWTIVTKMRDGEIGMDDEDKIISAHLDESKATEAQEEEDDSDMEMPDIEIDEEETK